MAQSAVKEDAMLFDIRQLIFMPSASLGHAMKTHFVLCKVGGIAWHLFPQYLMPAESGWKMVILP